MSVLLLVGCGSGMAICFGLELLLTRLQPDFKWCADYLPGAMQGACLDDKCAMLVTGQ